MKISSVRCYLLSCPLSEPLRFPFPGGERVLVKRDALIIRVEAENGLVGYAPGPAGEAARAAIFSDIAPFLEGRSLGDPDALRFKFEEGAGRDPARLRLYCAVEIALFDLLGKARKVPASDFLGGRVRDRIRVYANAGYCRAPEHFAEEAYSLSQMGFHAYKVHAGMGLERDRQAVELIRRFAGGGFDVMLDAEPWWRIGDPLYPASALDGFMADFGLTSPCRPVIIRPIAASASAIWLRSPLDKTSRTISGCSIFSSTRVSIICK
jgi:L-alanine-DL-glutamate epimerase-like enolase superfamily enzyme